MNIQISTFESNIIKFTSINMKHIQREIYSNGKKYSKIQNFLNIITFVISIHQNNNDRIALVYDNLCDDTIEKCP